MGMGKYNLSLEVDDRVIYLLIQDFKERLPTASR